MFRLECLGSDEGLRLRAIRLRAVLDAPDTFNTPFGEYVSWPEERWTAQLLASLVFIAVQNDLDVGMIRCTNDEQVGGTAWLVQLWVDPSVRRRGIGGALVDAVIDWARRNGIERLLLDVGAINEPAIDLYRSKGFEPNGVTSTMPPPREHIREHQMELQLR